MAYKIEDSLAIEELHCTICKELYTSPVDLPCGHTFCLECLRNWSAIGEHMSCPLCRQKSNISGVESLPKNEFIECLVDLKLNKCEDHCQICCHCEKCCICEIRCVGETLSIAKWRCLHCQQNICEDDCKRHKRQFTTKGHKIIKIIDFKHCRDNSISEKTDRCRKHPEFDVILYCADCREALCVNCSVETHNTHHFCKLEDKANECKELILKDIAKVFEAASCACDENLRNLQAEKQLTLKSVANIENSVNKHFRESVEILEQIRDGLCSKLKNIKEVQFKQIENNRQELEMCSTKLKSIRMGVEKLIDQSTLSELVCSAPKFVGDTLEAVHGASSRNVLNYDTFVEISLSSPNIDFIKLLAGHNVFGDVLVVKREKTHYEAVHSAFANEIGRIKIKEKDIYENDFSCPQESYQLPEDSSYKVQKKWVDVTSSYEGVSYQKQMQKSFQITSTAQPANPQDFNLQQSRDQPSADCGKVTPQSVVPQSFVQPAKDFLKFIAYAAQQNFDVIDVEDNGNCMFSALANQVGYDETDGDKVLRKEIVDYLGNHPEMMKNQDVDAIEGRSVSEYLEEMNQDGTWGDGIVLSAAVKLFHRPIELFQSDGQNIYIAISENSSGSTPIRLGYVALNDQLGRNHYVSVKPKPQKSRNNSPNFHERNTAVSNTEIMSNVVNEGSNGHHDVPHPRKGAIVPNSNNIDFNRHVFSSDENNMSVSKLESVQKKLIRQLTREIPCESIDPVETCEKLDQPPVDRIQKRVYFYNIATKQNPHSAKRDQRFKILRTQSKTLSLQCLRKTNSFTIYICKKNIVNDRNDVLVNPLNDSSPGNEAILRIAGQNISEECSKKSEGLKVGDMFHSSSGKINTAKHLLHVLAPSPSRCAPGNEDTSKILQQIFVNCLVYSAEKLTSVSTIGLHPIGIGGYGVQLVTRSMFRAFEEFDSYAASKETRALTLRNIKIYCREDKIADEMIGIFKTLID